MNTLKNKIKYPIIGLLVFLAFPVITFLSLGFLVGALVDTSQGQKIVLGFVNDKIPGSISMDKLNFSILKQEIQIHGLEIQGPDQKKVAEVEKILIGLDFSQLSDRQIILKKIEITAPCFYIEEEKNGELNIATCFTDLRTQAESAPSNNEPFVLPINIIVDQFSLEKGFFTFESQDMSIKTNSISIKGSGNIANEIMQINLTIGSATLALKNKYPINKDPIKKDQFKMDRLDLALSYQKRALSLIDLNFFSKPANLSLKGSVSNLFETPRADIVVDLMTDLEKISLLMSNALLTAPLPMEGIFKTNVKLMGTLVDPWIVLSINSDKGKIASRPFDKTNLKLELKKSVLTLEKLTANLDGGQVLGKGHLDLGQAFPKGFLEKGFPEKISADFTLKAEGFEPQILLEQEGLPNIHGKYWFEIGVKGTLEKPEATLYLTAMDAGYEDFPRANAAMDLAFSNDQLHIKQLVLTGLDSNLSLSGRIKAMENGKILPPGKIETDLEFVLSQINFDRANMSRNDLNQNELNPNQVNPNQVNQNKVNQNKVNQNKVNQEQIDLEKINQEKINWDRLKNLLPKELVEKGLLQGRLSMNSAVSGTLNDPNVFLNISGQNLAGQIVETNIQLDLKEKILSLEKFITVLAGGEVSGQGNVDLTQVFPKGFLGEIFPEKVAGNLNFKADKFEPQPILKLQGLTDIHGKYSFDANIEGTLSHPVANLHLSATGAGYKDFPRADVVIYLAFLNDHLEIKKLALTCLDSSLSLTGQIKIMENEQILAPEQMNFTTDMIFNGKNLEPFFELAGIKELEGAVGGTARINGNLKGIRELGAEVNIETFGLNYKKEYAIESRQIKASLKQGYLELFPAHLNFPDRGVFDVEAKGDIDETIEINAKGKIPVQAAGPFTTAVTDLRGDITTTIHALVGKDMKNNVITGSVQLNEIAMVIGETGQKLHGINGTILANPDRIEIQEIKGKLDAGNFALSGDVGLVDFFPDKANIHLQGNSLPIIMPDQMEALFQTDLTLRGTPKQAWLKGAIILESGEWMGDFNLEKTAFEKIMGLSRKETGPSQKNEDSIADKIELDLIVKANTPFLINNNLAYLEVNPNLKISGTAGNPAVSGQANLPSGTVTYHGKQFEVTKGIVDFIDPYGIKPELDLMAEHQIRDWNIVLALTGTPDNLILKLSSQPEEKDGDILSLLLTGKTTNELISSEGGTTTSPASLVAEMAASSLAGRVKKTVGLDIFEVGIDDNNTDSNLGNVNLTVGKEITDKITVTYGMENKDGEMVQKTATDYKLSDKFSVSGFQNTQGNYGAEVRYRLEFR